VATRRDLRANREPVVELTSDRTGMLELRVRNMAEFGLRVDRINVIWPPGGKLMETLAPLPEDNRWRRGLNPRLSVKPKGTKGDSLRIGSSDEHQVSLRFWPTSRLFWTLSRWSRSARRSGQISLMTIARIHLSDEKQRKIKL